MEKNTKEFQPSTNAVENLSELLKAYAELEELMAESIKINIDQLDKKLTKEQAEALLFELAGAHIDLDTKIFALKKSLGLVQPQKSVAEKINGQD